MRENQTSDYEDLTYTNNAYASSHPVTLATLAALYGLAPPPLEGCRVLELGCGRGGNLLPMAENMPDGEFIGVDLSPRQIEEANASRATLGLKNVVFHTLDIDCIDGELGDFDYILAHGVYSWVPPHVQDQLLRVCAENLSPNGLAYISYNTYPGWHYRGVVRDLLNQYVQRDGSAGMQVAHARQILDVVVKALPDQTGIRTRLVIDESQALMGQADGYIYHEHLEPDNRPCYFHQFVRHAGEHGLKYVAEAQVSPLREGITPSARQAIQQSIGSDRLRNEQLIDFLIHRTIRRSILCRAERTAADAIQSERLRDCYVTSCSTPDEDRGQLLSTLPLRFVTRSGDSMTTNHPLVKATLVALHELGPQAMSFRELARAVAGRMYKSCDEDFESELAGLLVATYHRGAIELRVKPTKFCPNVTTWPLASPVAQFQARGDSRVTSREHRSIDLNPIDRLLLMHMNGNRDIEMLKAVVRQKLHAREVHVKGFDQLAGEAEQSVFLQRLIEQRARYLAHNGFLIG
jgi:SAM-dependent methyltransferase/methyltransferase-like protein